MSKALNIESTGFYVSHSLHYLKFIRKHNKFESGSDIVKEWDIYKKASLIKPDFNVLKRFEELIGEPGLWTPIVTDRRLYMGKDSVFTQDYKPRYTTDEMLAIVQTGCVEIEKLFERLKPDIVVSHYTPTFGDCLAHMFAKAYSIPSLDLRLSRLENYVMAVDGINEPPQHIQKIFEKYKKVEIPQDLRNRASSIIEKSRSQNSLYEGVVKAGKLETSTLSGTVKEVLSPRNFLGALKSLQLSLSIRKLLKGDPHLVDPFRNYYVRNYRNKIRSYFTLHSLRKRIITHDQLGRHDFILYPLHTEPELVLAQFARPYLNQIEIIRNIAFSVPTGIKVFVKEHPLMYERRPLGYYEKILEIPNVYLLDFSMPSEIALKYAKMVIIIRGAIGLEAVINKLPVLSFGYSIYDLLPKTMFRRVENLYKLSENIFDMLNNYKYEEDELINYIASVLEGSVPVNLMTDLLGKKGRHRTETVDENIQYENHPHFDLLNNYLLKRITQIGIVNSK